MNGHIVEGEIISSDPNGSVKIRTKDGQISAYSFNNEVLEFVKE